jgi:hypothetical protein
MRQYTTHCPNCDTDLPIRLWDGTEWQCTRCGELVTFTARPETSFVSLRDKHVDDLCRWAEMTAAQVIAEVGVQKYLEIAREIAEMCQPTPNDLPF